MSPGATVASVAAEMRAAQDQVRQLAPISGRVEGFDLAFAYRVAEAIHRGRLSEGRRTPGRKIGFTNTTIWDEYGVHHPIWGFMYEDTVTHVADGRAACPMAGLAEPRLEPEIAFRLARPVPPGASPAQVLDCVDGIAHAFELVQSHFPAWRFAAADTIADQALHGRLYVGPFRDPRSMGDLVPALERFTVTLRRGGESVETAVGANVLGSPLKALAHLANVVSTQGSWAELRPGEIISTGTITRAYPVRAGETWASQFAGLDLPGMEIRFT